MASKLGISDAIYQWLIDNPGWHFTEDIIEGIAGKFPEVESRRFSNVLYQLERSLKRRIEMGGSNLTRKWRYKP